jgi:hypothetical protein
MYHLFQCHTILTKISACLGKSLNWNDVYFVVGKERILGASGNLVEALCYKPEGRKFDSR